jgi:hypothetical protein
MIPEYIINTFYNRIEKKLNLGHSKNSVSIKRELDRIKLINGDIIPKNIKELLK